MESLLPTLGGNTPTVGSDDLFIWWRNSSGFSVKATYVMVLERNVWGSTLDDNLNGFRKTKIPNKVLNFGWRLL